MNWERIEQLAVYWGPKILVAILILVAAIIIGKVLSWAARYMIGKIGSDKHEADKKALGRTVGSALFWITILISLPLILGVLELDGLLAPVQAMAKKFLDFLPNLIGAALIFGIGWIVALVAKKAVTSVLSAIGIDDLAERSGLKSLKDEEPEVLAARKSDPKAAGTPAGTGAAATAGTTPGGSTSIAKVVGYLVFALIIIPVSIAALETLDLKAISEPAKQMLQSILDALPRIFAAAVVLLLAFVIGRFAKRLITGLLHSVGFDTVAAKIGLSKQTLGGTSLSKVAGIVAFAAIMVFGLVEAARLLDFEILSTMLTAILTLGAQILLGSVIILVGVAVANFVAGLIENSSAAGSAAFPIKIVIIVLATAMGLRQMGVGDEIIIAGFTLLMLGIAVAFALAFGLGARETAGRLAEKWANKLDGSGRSTTAPPKKS